MIAFWRINRGLCGKVVGKNRNFGDKGQGRIGFFRKAGWGPNGHPIVVFAIVV